MGSASQSSRVDPADAQEVHELAFEWAMSADTKDWDRMRQILAPKLNIDYTDVANQVFTDISPDDWIKHSESPNSMDKEVPSKVAGAVLPLGFPPKNLKDLIQALLSNNADLVAKVPGITSEISLAAQGGLYEAYSISFRHVWIAATCFCAAGLLSSLFLRNSKSDFNAHIDAPVDVDRKFGDATSSKSIEHAEHAEIAPVERAA